MSKKIKVVINPDGIAASVMCDELIPMVKKIGANVIKASYIEPRNSEKGFDGFMVDFGPVGGQIYGPFISREEALIFEHKFLEDNMSNMLCRQQAVID